MREMGGLSEAKSQKTLSVGLRQHGASQRARQWVRRMALA